jgi:outer membrane protein TolC
VLRAEDALRTLALDPDAPDFWTVRIEPTDALPPMVSQPDVEVAIRRALQDRTDLARARAQLDNAHTAVALRENQRLPDLRLDATLTTVGVGGRRLITNGAFPPVVLGTAQTGFGDVLGQIATGDFPTWTLGVSLRYPIGQSFEEADLARARLEEQRARAAIRPLEIQAAREIRSAALEVDSTAKQIDSTRVARELAEQRLDAEQKRFDVGMSTSFLVVQAQRDLAQARIAEVRARLDHERARIDFETLQEAPPSSAGAALGGGAVSGATTNLAAPAVTSSATTSAASARRE